MALGEFRFSIGTAAYQRLVRYSSERWANVPRIGRAPAMQHLGAGEDTVTLDGVIYPAYRGGLGQLDRMRATAERGEPLELVSGAGFVFDRVVILSVEEAQSNFLSVGAPLKQEFRISLARYGEDAA